MANDKLTLISEEDVVSTRGTRGTRGRKTVGEYGDKEKLVIKKKKEKPVRILRIKYYDKTTCKFMEDGKLEYKEVFAVSRGLEDLLKELYYNTNINGIVAPPDCIFVEKDDRIGANDKFLFVEIRMNEFHILKKEMENYRTIYAYNKGEFIIIEGTKTGLSETFDMPNIWRRQGEIIGNENDRIFGSIAEVPRAGIRKQLIEELKDRFRSYHPYTDEEIDKMKNGELIETKRLVNQKIKIENTKRKKFEKVR